MKYAYLLIAGFGISLVHFFLVWRQKDTKLWSISEYATLDKKTHLLYFVSHVICEIFFLLFSYQFFVIEQATYLPFYLNIVFAVLDFAQAAIPSMGKTEKIHIAAAYVSWCCYLASGIAALLLLTIAQPYTLLALLFLVPTIGVFIYMHVDRSRLYPYQLLMVPLYVTSLLFITIGASV
jgi:hypothetical protein